MFKKTIGYTLVVIGFLCFLFVAGGSMRYRNRSAFEDISVSDSIALVVSLIVIPVVGFFLIKVGFWIIGRNKKS